MNTILDQEHGGYSKEITKDFFKNVYAYMFGALTISGIIAFWAGTPEFFTKYFVNATQTGLSPLFYVVAFAPVGLGLLMQTMYNRLSLGLLMILFLVYSALMGLSLSSIMLVYAGSQIAMTFFVTAGAFAGMAILGYTTKTDLTKMGSLLYMVFIGMFIAGIANIWIKSNMMGFVIAVLGVFVFTGLTAYYMQQLKDTAKNQALSQVDRSKLALVGGLMLYILFVNLFLSLLRLLGSRD
jgi:FtsH-binding integral membrane protein